MKRKICFILAFVVVISTVFSGCDNLISDIFSVESSTEAESHVTFPLTDYEVYEKTASFVPPFQVDDIPDFSTEPYVEINNNVSFFTEDEYTTSSYEYYSDLDSLRRCGVCYACVGQDIMPTEERGPIGMVKPTGWHISKYDFVNGKYLYNRCHLLGYQLTGENANENNLITGTRYLNITGMLPFENKIADYVHDTNNHVMYRVTPMFVENDLVASGLLMEGYSVEDSGEGVHFCVYCYNAQPGVTIDYATGENWSDGTLD